MSYTFWKRVKEEIAVWYVGVIPGTVVISLVILARLLGGMQSLEWLAFDSFLQNRPAESIDDRILIVGINESDIRTLKHYPMSDRELSNLLQKISSYKPRVIGLDIVRDLPVEPGHTELIATFKQIENLIAIEKVLPEKIEPPRHLAPEKIGFADQIIDIDGKLRRSLLGTTVGNDYRFSLTLSLAKKYLAKEGFILENGINNPDAFRFRTTELPMFVADSGGYVRADAGGAQVLLNYRSGGDRFPIVSLNDIKNNQVNPNLIRDRILIIGVTAPSIKDLVATSATKSSKAPPGRMYGVEVQAHAVSQILSAVLNKRPLITAWTDIQEYLWIIAWGILGIVLAKLTKSPFKNFFAVAIASTTLLGICYSLILIGYWVPLTPTILVLLLNGIGLTALYQYDQALSARINARQTLIERTFETIHNGPLQTLAKVLKRVRDIPKFSPESQNETIQNTTVSNSTEKNNIDILPTAELLWELEKDLEKLNCELRGIYEFLQQEPLAQDSTLYLGQGLLLNLEDPIHEVLFQVYNRTLERDFPCFKTVRINIRSFEPINHNHLSVEQKIGLCRFLEEALCNVGKHATGVTKLEVTCAPDEDFYTISIIDNGLAANSFNEGTGTQQCRNIARLLKGKFLRSRLSPRGTMCKLSWRIRRKFWFCK
jgi:CHASE2 domain-containing sensor protein